METSPTYEETKKKALRYAGNTWRRFLAYKVRYAKKYTGSSERKPADFFNNRLIEDTFAVDIEANVLRHGHTIERRQELADPMLQFRASLEDPSLFDDEFSASLERRMPDCVVDIVDAMSSSAKNPSKKSIRTFVTSL